MPFNSKQKGFRRCAHLKRFAVPLNSLELKVYSDAWYVRLDEAIVRVTQHEIGLSDRSVGGFLSQVMGRKDVHVVLETTYVPRSPCMRILIR